MTNFHMLDFGWLTKVFIISLRIKPGIKRSNIIN